MECIVRSLRSFFRTGVKDGNSWTIDKCIITFEYNDFSPLLRRDMQQRKAFGPNFKTIEIDNKFNELVFVNEGLPVSSFYDLEGCKVKIHYNSEKPDRVDCIEVIGIDGAEIK